jgi:hypothetical protein
VCDLVTAKSKRSSVASFNFVYIKISSVLDWRARSG